jgi:hypothetical protein
LDRRLGGPQSRSERHGEERNLDLTGTRTQIALTVDTIKENMEGKNVDKNEMRRREQ